MEKISPKALVLIPARYDSQRFPGKPLAMIDGKSMIQRVYENCARSGAETFVVTDSSKIESHVQEFGHVCRVDDCVQSGSERILLAYERFFSTKNYDLILNVQGDEPLINSQDLSKLINFHTHSSFAIGTMVKRMPLNHSDLASVNHFQDPNRVKVIFGEKSGQCLYFSRAPIPFSRDLKQNFWFYHIGIYSYRPEVLKSFFSWGPSYYESQEKLEQLRALENGMTIGAVETDSTLIGVDTPEDLQKVLGVLRGQAY